MKHRRAYLLTGGLLAALVLLLPSPAEALYLFFLREDLARKIAEEPEEIVGKQVVVTDELIRVWPEAPERPSRYRGQEYVVFDTEYFHCAVPRRSMGAHLQAVWDDAAEGYSQVLKDIEAINDRVHARELSAGEAADQRRELVWDLYRIYDNQPIATLFGTVARADFWGPVDGEAVGVETERVTIVCDRVEKPRERWYHYGLDGQIEDDPLGVNER